MPKIVHINTVADPRNGVGGIVGSIHEAAAQHGWESHVVVGRSTPRMIDGARAVGGKVGLYVNALRARLWDNEGRNAETATRRVVKALDEIGPDVVHVHNLHGYYINLPMLGRWFERSGVPLVVTLHDCWMMTGHCCFQPSGGCDRWMGRCVDCPARRIYPKAWRRGDTAENMAMKHRFLGSASDVLIVSPSAKMDVDLSRSMLGDLRHTVIGNGVDRTVFCPDNSVKGKGGRMMVLGVASLWDDRKNPDLFNRLTRDFGDELDVVLVGHVNRAMHPAVRCVGPVADEQVLAGIYRQASVLLNASYGESFGMVTAEAIACGTPVVINSASGMDELIADGCGVAVDCNDVPAVVKAIKEASRISPRLPDRFSREAMAHGYYREYAGMVRQLPE